MSKVYVVWVGRKPGIYNTWPEAQSQISGFSNAKYKAVPANIAKKAFKDGWEAYYGVAKAPITASKAPNHECLTVDAAFSMKTQRMEWQGKYNISREIPFASRVYIGGSNNIGEFLALIDGIKHLRATGRTDLEIYSDSQTALAWIREGKHNSTIKKSNLESEIIDALSDAETYLAQFPPKEIKFKKWDTPNWGQEIPADYGRK